jgi:hypothetical protein
MNRRSFIGSILALASAPAIVRADSLMRIVPRETVILPYLLYPVHCDEWRAFGGGTIYIRSSGGGIDIAGHTWRPIGCATISEIKTPPEGGAPC